MVRIGNYVQMIAGNSDDTCFVSRTHQINCSFWTIIRPSLTLCMEWGSQVGKTTVVCGSRDDSGEVLGGG